MAIKLDEARIRLLKITDTGGNKHISFSRGSYNYIAAPSNGTIGLIANDTLSAAGCAMVIGSTSVYPGTTNTVSLGTSSYKWANVYATTFTGALTGNVTGNVSGSSSSCTGNAATASALTSITTTDAASSSATWRRLWMCYSDNATGRPAYDDRFAIQTSTGTLKAPIFSGSLSGNASTATILATARSLKISETAGTTGTSFNGSGDATLIIPTTVKGFTELGTNKISSASSTALYISPSSTLYLDSAASTSLIFRPQGTEKARFDTSGNFLIKTAMYPGTNNSYSLGTSSYKWKYIYGITAYTNTYYAGTATAKGNIYLQASGDSSTVATYARFYVNAAGTVGDGTNAVNGSVYLILGNSTASSTTTSAGLNNAYGMLRLYGTGTTYQNLRALNGSNSRTTYLRDHGATAYLVSTTTTSAVGSSTGPVYINSSGVATACGTSLAVSITGNAATATKLGTSTIGAADRPIYLSSGTATQTTYRMAATNATATTGISITTDLPTGIWYVNGTSDILGQSDGVAIVNQYNSSWITEIYQDYRTGQLAVRGKNSGTWQAWRKVLDSTNYSSYALPLAGGTMNSGAQILRASSSQSWVNGRKGALLAHAYASANRFTGNQYNPLWSAKSIAGSWDCGTYTANNNLYFSYITDANFDAGTNTTTHQVIISGTDGKITASGFVGDVTGNVSGSATKVKMASTGISATATTDGLLEAGIVRFDTVGSGGTSIANDGIVATFGWSATYGAQIWLDDGSGAAQMQVRNRTASAWNAWRKVWMEGDSVTGAVWNDYAEYRESDCKEFGRVLTEKGDDTLTKTTKRLQAFAGISSDTWGFCQGETDKAKTPIAVAGRVLAYTYRNRKEYKPGDCVCAAPDGTVDIMTREEIIQYPDRIVGTVSCVPEYETWGSGDRDPVNVDNRIWIKVR